MERSFREEENGRHATHEPLLRSALFADAETPFLPLSRLESTYMTARAEPPKNEEGSVIFEIGDDGMVTDEDDEQKAMHTASAASQFALEMSVGIYFVDALIATLSFHKIIPTIQGMLNGAPLWSPDVATSLALLGVIGAFTGLGYLFTRMYKSAYRQALEEERKKIIHRKQGIIRKTTASSR